MSDIKCHIIKDLLPLYLENLVSDETKNDIDLHIKKCKYCCEYIKDMDEDINLDMESDDLDEIGDSLINKIKKSQDRLKYTFIIFSMFVSVATSLLATGIFATIPLVVIMPFILKLFFDENLIIYVSAMCTNFLVCIASDNVGMSFYSGLVYIICISGGLILGKVVKENLK